MIRIATSSRTLGATRLATGPLWELVASLYLLGTGRVSWPYDTWAGRARRALGDEACAPLLHLTAQPEEFPDFMLPNPGPADLDAALGDLRGTDPALVRDELRRRFGRTVPEALKPYDADPEGAMAALADAYAAYWRAAMTPVLPVLHDVLDTEIMVRGRSLALAGLDGLLGNLDDRIRWQDDRLDMLKPHRVEIDASERTLVLVPLVFGGGDRLMAAWDARSVTIAYPARGAARLADRGGAGRNSLALLLGTGRATVLATLHQPITTRALARHLGLAPSTISEHLRLLTRAGVVDRLPSGQQVYYQANETGRALLESLG